jgi:hypothetical protein
MEDSEISCSEPARLTAYSGDAIDDAEEVIEVDAGESDDSDDGESGSSASILQSSGAT